MLVIDRDAFVLGEVGAVFRSGKLVAGALGVVEDVERLVFRGEEFEIDEGGLRFEQDGRAVDEDFSKQQSRDDDDEIGRAPEQ